MRTLYCACALAVGLLGCPPAYNELCSFGTCDPLSDGGEGGTNEDVLADGGADGGTDGGEGGDALPGCDGTKAPGEDPCVIAEDYGVFVDGANGADTNPGTKAAPKMTLKAGIEAAQGKRVYVCATSTYAEALSIDGTHDGIALYGGFSDCATWAYSTATKALVKPASGAALTVKELTTGAVVADMAFESADGVGAGASSIAVFVANSQNVLFRRVSMTAGKGVGADSAADGTNYSSATTLNGKGPTGTAGADGGQSACAHGSSAGGKGGSGAGSLAQATGGTGIWDPAGSIQTGYEGTGGTGSSSCDTGSKKGSSGAAAAAAEGAAKWGTLDKNGWMPASGFAGGNGAPGQGGGGGGGQPSAITPIGGGGGGAGGCGGGGGAAGQGGGSSFALLTLNAPVKLESCALKASDAGRGGAGGNGQVGQPGGSGGDPGGGVCGGAFGGNGAGGGGGGGGAGGVSACIAFVGASPIQDTITCAHGATAPLGGAVGTGMAGGTNGQSPIGGHGADGKPGKPGAAADVVDVSQ